jgi:ethanolamine ammonia-lyase small subunit
VPAVSRQVPALLPLLYLGAESSGWRAGRTFVIRHCRVGILNEIGALLDPRVVVLLIGERPGLAAVDSLSAYMAYRPREDHSDADRNLISNIHARGVRSTYAATRILSLAAQIMQAGASGCSLKENRQMLS